MIPRKLFSPIIRFLQALGCIFLISGCSQKLSLPQAQSGYSLLSDEVKRQIRTVEKSVVGVNAHIDYEVLTFQYDLPAGKVVRDRESPVGYRLSDTGGIVRTLDDKSLSGGGLILTRQHEPSRYLILTSSHLVSPKDTTDTHYVDENGNSTGVVFQRRIIKQVALSVRGSGNWRVKATLLAHDSVDDIALITVATDRNLGPEYRNTVGYDIDLGWGDWVFMFGYPREIKQMTGGWVSNSPYRGTFAVDAVVRFGFSGGPVFALSKRRTELALVGLIKSVPSGALEYIGPDDSLPVGYLLKAEDIGKLTVKRETMVNYGSVYCVNPGSIRNFMQRVRPALEREAIILDPGFY